MLVRAEGVVIPVEDAVEEVREIDVIEGLTAGLHGEAWAQCGDEVGCGFFLAVGDIVVEGLRDLELWLEGHRTLLDEEHLGWFESNGGRCAGKR